MLRAIYLALAVLALVLSALTTRTAPTLPAEFSARIAPLFSLGHRLGQNLRAGLEDAGLASLVPITRGDEADRAVQVLLVVPAHEAAGPRASFIDRFEGAHRILRSVLRRSKGGLREGVVVGDAGAAEGRGDAELLELREHVRALHRSAVVGVQDERPFTHRLGGARHLQQSGGEG